MTQEALFPGLPPQTKRRRLGLVAVIGAAVALAIVLDAPPSVAIVGTLAAAVLLATLAWKSWQFGLFAFFGWFLVEDLVRKYSGNAMVLYAGKEIIYLSALAGFAVAAWRRRAPVAHNPVLVPVLTLLAWALIESVPLLAHRPSSRSSA